ncbi:hypothetical protein F442_03718 [Phytophthora nicotianae P10297]|uniref:Secreted protein n=1 Tax=Phytophthora nicotianae P10297 TaxID=1317064 RepID=W2ZUS9_PHYNI|nr:hypothetical protein F442_03718 [Phytophthora nicotianae P10297]
MTSVGTSSLLLVVTAVISSTVDTTTTTRLLMPEASINTPMAKVLTTNTRETMATDTTACHPTAVILDPGVTAAVGNFPLVQTLARILLRVIQVAN